MSIEDYWDGEWKDRQDKIKIRSKYDNDASVSDELLDTIELGSALIDEPNELLNDNNIKWLRCRAMIYDSLDIYDIY